MYCVWLAADPSVAIKVNVKDAHDEVNLKMYAMKENDSPGTSRPTSKLPDEHGQVPEENTEYRMRPQNLHPEGSAWRRKAPRRR